MMMMMLENAVGSSKKAQLGQSSLSHSATKLDMHQTPSAIESRGFRRIMISLAGVGKSLGVRAYFEPACGRRVSQRKAIVGGQTSRYQKALLSEGNEWA